MSSRLVLDELSIDTSVDPLTAAIEREAHELAERARAASLVVSIEQVSTPPWASGRHVDVIKVRPARRPGGVY